MDIVEKYCDICDIKLNGVIIMVSNDMLESIDINTSIRSYEDICEIIDLFLKVKNIKIDFSEFVTYVQSKIPDVEYQRVCHHEYTDHIIKFKSQRTFKLQYIIGNTREEIYKYLDNIIEIELGKNEILNYLNMPNDKFKTSVLIDYNYASCRMSISFNIYIHFMKYMRCFNMLNFSINNSQYFKILDNYDFSIVNMQKIIDYELEFYDIFNSLLDNKTVKMFEIFVNEFGRPPYEPCVEKRKNMLNNALKIFNIINDKINLYDLKYKYCVTVTIENNKLFVFGKTFMLDDVEDLIKYIKLNYPNISV